MARLVKNMDNIVKLGHLSPRMLGKGMGFEVGHWAPIPRRYPTALPVETLGYIPRKDQWIRRRFSTCNFSFVLSGGGEYRQGGRMWTVEAPAVLTQWPGVPVEYGPCGHWSAWEELYVIYSRRCMPALRRVGYAREDKPCWRVLDAVGLQEKIEELQRATTDASAEGAADRVDRICEAMILESLLSESQPEPDAADRGVYAIVQKVRQNFREKIDWEVEAARQGMSDSTFRRRWMDLVDLPPAAFQERLRMREARRMLVESRRPVGEVAERCGFADALYFSRRFRAATGMAPRVYRERFQRDAAGG